MTTEEMENLDAWIQINVFGYTKQKEQGYPFRSGYFHQETEDFVLVFDAPKYTTCPADAIELLKRCLGKVSTGSLEIYQGCDEAPEYNPVYGITLKEWNQVIMAETLELAICKFSQKLYSK